MSSLRSLERQLVCQRAQIRTAAVASDYLDCWEIALSNGEPTPDPFDFLRAVARVGVPILRGNPVVSYLERCADDQTLPEINRIVEAVVHGFALTRLAHANKPCRCPARAITLKNPLAYH